MIPDTPEQSMSSLEDATSTPTQQSPRRARMGGMVKALSFSLKKSPSKRSLMEKSPSKRRLMEKSPSKRRLMEKSPSKRRLLAALNPNNSSNNSSSSNNNNIVNIKDMTRAERDLMIRDAIVNSMPSTVSTSDDGSVSTSSHYNNNNSQMNNSFSSFSPSSPTRRGSGGNRVFRLKKRRSLTQNTQPLMTVLLQKRVSFASEAHNQVHELPRTTKLDLVNTFYTKKELHNMASAAQRLAEETAWKKDRQVLRCLHFCYGFSNKTSSSSSAFNHQQPEAMTQESSMQYYYYYQAEEADGTPTTLRGLERQVTSQIMEYRMSSIQAVLAQQTKLQDNSNNNKDPAEQLRKCATSWSHSSRKMARLLGKADAAIVGMKTQTKPETHNSKKKKNQQHPSSSFSSLSSTFHDSCSTSIATSPLSPKKKSCLLSSNSEHVSSPKSKKSVGPTHSNNKLVSMSAHISSRRS